MRELFKLMAVFTLIGFVILGIGLALENSSKEVISRIGSATITIIITIIIAVTFIYNMNMHSDHIYNILKIDKYTNVENKIIYEVTYEDTIINKTIWITEDKYEQYVNNNKLVISDTNIEYLRKVII